jgi:hypothetical protein
VRHVVLIVLMLVAAAGCAAQWPEENRAAFTSACLANARKTRPGTSEEALAAYCKCAVERAQAEYTLEEFKALEAQSVRENKPAMGLVRLVEDCAGRLR